ncbi:MAG: bifunctional phosphopantothenoylcysteine decarboxylase/phosphopantothenate--cysteine ligase CoaBC, partial [Balneolaceae bacterium]
MMKLSGKRILLGVTGSIAAYKSAYLLREFQKSGASVRVTMSSSATRFVGIETFSTLSRHPVAVDLFNDAGKDPSHSWTQHIQWGDWADLFVIAPCTANTLAKLVHGQSDNMLTSVALAARCPILICPVMDAEMIHHPAVERNLELAVEMGFYILEPESGYLASGLEGTGRLPEPDDILKKSLDIFEVRRKKGPLSKKKVLVTAGPTREAIDPVRYISNPSSGKMGVAMAEAAHDLGGEVTLLHGPVSIPIPDTLNALEFRSADDLFQLIQNHSDSEVVIMSAAVSDFKPIDREEHKIKKEDSGLTLQLSQTPDSLAWLGKNKKKDQILIGFAMETENLEKNARKKLKGKNLDWILANQLNQENSGFESDSNRIVAFGNEERLEFEGEKRIIAKKILKHIFSSAG